MGHHEHEAEAPKNLKIGIITLSDTRSPEEDISGDILKELLKDAGHEIVRYSLIREDPEGILATLRDFLAADLDAIVTNGGTGLTSRDGTIEVAKTLLEKELPGFGELFRFLSFQQIGPAAILSRATAGMAAGKILVCLPGSSKAVRLAVSRILVPQLPHMIREIRR
jgi:molybdenum cofactor biosynthesis protein B